MSRYTQRGGLVFAALFAGIVAGCGGGDPDDPIVIPDPDGPTPTCGETTAEIVYSVRSDTGQAEATVRRAVQAEGSAEVTVSEGRVALPFTVSVRVPAGTSVPLSAVARAGQTVTAERLVRRCGNQVAGARRTAGASAVEVTVALPELTVSF